VRRAVRRLSPDSLAATAADRALETGARLRLFAQDVRAGMAQREGELHDALGLRTAGGQAGRPGPQGRPELRGRAEPRVLPAPDPDLPAARRDTAYDEHDEHDTYDAHETRKDEH
jgi:hypothetical protein